MDEYLTDAELCEILKVSWRTLLRMRTGGTGPEYIRIGERRIVYSRAAVEAWLGRRTHKHRAAEAVSAAHP
jgi:predicted DNA-binding transcriptional regulator AlpA